MAITKYAHAIIITILSPFYIELNEYMMELDSRYETKIKKDDGAVMAKKSRKLGEPSTSHVPPKWAIMSKYMQRNCLWQAICS